MAEEAIQHLGVEGLQQSGEGREQWVSVKLPLRQEVEELLGQPVQDAQCHHVHFPFSLSIVHHQAEVEVGPQLLDAFPVLYCKRGHLAHHQVNEYAVSGEAVAAGGRGGWELHIILLKLLGIGKGHGAPQIPQ